MSKYYAKKIAGFSPARREEGGERSEERHDAHLFLTALKAGINI